LVDLAENAGAKKPQQSKNFFLITTFDTMLSAFFGAGFFKLHSTEDLQHNIAILICIPIL